MTPLSLGLGGFGVALLALLILYGVALIATWLARMLSGSGIPVVSDALGSAVRSLSGAAMRAMSNLLKSSMSGFGAIFNFLWGVPYDTNRRAQSHAGAINNRVGAIIKTTIPAAKATAISHANAAIYAEAVKAQESLDAVASALIGDINTETMHREQQALVIRAALESEIDTVDKQLSAAIEAVDVSLTDSLNGLASRVESALLLLERTVAAQLGALRTSLLTDLESIEGYTKSVATALGKYAETAAGQAQTNVVTWTDASAAAAVAGLWPGIVKPATDARTGVAAEAPGVLTGSVSIPTVAPVDLVAALAAVGTMAATAVTYVDECGLGLCGNLLGFGNLLNDLNDLFVDGALLAYLTWALTHPADAAADVSDVATDIITPIFDLVKDLV